MVLAIRSAEAEDSESLIEFLTHINGYKFKTRAAEYVHAMFSDSFRKPYFVVALDGTDFIGAVAYSEEIFTVNIWGLSWISVNEATRHKNTERLIIEETIRQITKKAQSTISVTLACPPHKIPFYEKLGFIAVGIGNEERRFMALTIQKSLH